LLTEYGLEDKLIGHKLVGQSTLDEEEEVSLVSFQSWRI
jgi:hypothetical protein